MVGINWWMKPITRMTPANEKRSLSTAGMSKSAKVKNFFVNILIRQENAPITIRQSSFRTESETSETFNETISESSNL